MPVLDALAAARRPDEQLPVGHQQERNVYQDANVADDSGKAWHPSHRHVPRAGEAPATNGQELHAVKAELQDLVQQREDAAERPDDGEAGGPEKVEEQFDVLIEGLVLPPLALEENCAEPRTLGLRALFSIVLLGGDFNATAAVAVKPALQLLGGGRLRRLVLSHRGRPPADEAQAADRAAVGLKDQHRDPQDEVKGRQKNTCHTVPSAATTAAVLVGRGTLEAAPPLA
mmetsp:Transcript_13944/g.39816  ORF Transcript_13944/g.39816 Transcript_13944/m.39816 type:complete len:229 (+) Transcript_13944:424-1110(+)